MKPQIIIWPFIEKDLTHQDASFIFATVGQVQYCLCVLACFYSKSNLYFISVVFTFFVQ